MTINIHPGTLETGSPSSKKKLLMWIAGLVTLGVMLWALIGLIAQVWLEIQVPLTKEDLANTSWLGSPNMALHFTSGFVAYMLWLGIVIMGAAAAVARGTVVPMLAAVLMVFCAYFGAGEAAAVRVGMLEGVIRIGCYVPETTECRAMIGLAPDVDAASRYDSRSATGDATWYTERRKMIVTPAQEQRSALSSLPGAALLMAPWHITHSTQLIKLLVKQRNDVTNMRVTDHATQPRKEVERN